MPDPDVYPGSSWKGKAVEQLIAAKCVLGSNGNLNVSIPFVDDAGVDLVFNLRGHPTTLAIQVKARFRRAQLTKNTFMTQVRNATFTPRADFALLFALYDDKETQDLERAWLVPSLDFDERTRNAKSAHTRRVFAVSLGGTKGMWQVFDCAPAKLSGEIERMLRSLEPN